MIIVMMMMMMTMIMTMTMTCCPLQILASSRLQRSLWLVKLCDHRDDDNDDVVMRVMRMMIMIMLLTLTPPLSPQILGSSRLQRSLWLVELAVQQNLSHGSHVKYRCYPAIAQVDAKLQVPLARELSWLY
jgi:hypothetical protein